VLSRSFGLISSLECRFLELGALAPVCIHDNGFVVALDDERHDTDGGVQVRVGDQDAVENVGSTGWLVNDLRQAHSLHYVLIRQLV